MPFTISQPIRQSLQIANMLLDICATFESSGGLVPKPEFPTATIQQGTEKIQQKINNIRMQLPDVSDLAMAVVAPEITQTKFDTNLAKEYAENKKTQETESDDDSVSVSDTDSKKEKKKSAKEKRKERKEKVEEDNKSKLKEALNKRIVALQQQMTAVIAEAKYEYERQLHEWKLTLEIIKKNYIDADTRLSFGEVTADVLDGIAGDGMIRINKICDDIEDMVNKITDITTKIIVMVSSMTAKSAMPADVGSCVPNPGYKLSDFIIDLYDIYTLIMDVKTYYEAISTDLEDLRISDFSKIPDKLKNLSLENLIAFDLSAINPLLNKQKEMEELKKKAQAQAEAATIAMKRKQAKTYTNVYENMEEGTGDIKYYKRPVFNSITDPEDMSIKGWNLYYNKTQFKSYATKKWSSISLDTKMLYNNNKLIYQSKLQNDLIYQSNETPDNSDRIWFAFVETSDINGGNDYVVEEETKETTKAKVSNTNVSGINGYIIELENGKKYVVDSEPVSGSTIKLPSGEYVYIE